MNLPIIERDSEPDHYHKSCSGAKQWKNCGGSVNTPRPKWALKDTGGPAAERGSLGHAMVECELKGLDLDPGWQQQLDEMGDSDRGFLEWQVDVCVNFVRDLLKQETWTHSGIEIKIRSKTISHHGGTIDILLVSDTTIWIVDFKFGDVIVHAIDNDQLMAYMHLARQEYPGRQKFFATIMQPSDSPDPDTTEFTHDQLQDDLLWMIEASESTEFKAGDWCKHCPRGAHCDYNRADLEAELAEFPNLMEKAATEDPTPDDIRQVEKVVALARRAAKAAEDGAKLLKAWSQRGLKLNTHHVREEYRRAWADPKKVAGQMAGRLDGRDPLEACYEPKLRTPRQLYMAHFKDKMSINEFYDEFGEVLKVTKTEKLISGRPKSDVCRDPELPDLTP